MQIQEHNHRHDKKKIQMSLHFTVNNPNIKATWANENPPSPLFISLKYSIRPFPDYADVCTFR